MAAFVKSVNKKLACKDLLAYVKTLSPSVLEGLYNHPASCLAIFRELPDFAKHYVMRILFVEQVMVKQNVVATWVEKDYANEHLDAIKSLTGLHIVHEHMQYCGLPAWKLNESFKKSLQIALMGGGNGANSLEMLPPDKYAKDIAFLDSYAQERWECILHYIVQSKEGSGGISREVTEILLHSGLVSKDAADGDTFITAAGFQFLLLDISSQIWYFMIRYLETVESRGMNIVECLTFMFQLSFLTLGKDYSSDKMSDNQQRFLQHLREFGLVYQRKRKCQRFYPTRLAINLTSSTPKDVALDTHKQGFIMVETNYRVYAYTASPLQVNLLSAFCIILYRFPNMVVASITRESVRAAFASGITAEQIINFLKSHAHPEMLKKKPVIPPTITDQILLWELERNRFNFDDGVLYSQFVSQRDFELLRDYAKDLSVLVWENPPKRILVVTRSGHEEVKRFWKRHKRDT